MGIRESWHGNCSELHNANHAGTYEQDGKKAKAKETRSARSTDVNPAVVRSEAEKELAELIAANTSGVADVRNQLRNNND